MAAPLPAETTTIYLADGASLCLPAVRNVGEALAAAVANLKVQRPHARYLAVHAADATGAVAATPATKAACARSELLPELSTTLASASAVSFRPSDKASTEAAYRRS